ncbi:MAG: hypothetical protein QG589_148 [Patescibacteria group bacterium]|nr:hypothetical protein [Patescibacteria group bacterium]
MITHPEWQYIGITGFMSREEAILARAAFPARVLLHNFMTGVLASSKTLAGGTNKWPSRYPKVEAISEIFLNDRNSLNLIHYSTDDTGPDSFRDQLEQLVKIGGPNLHGFQLNVVWPSITMIRNFRESHPDMQIVLQVGKRAMGQYEHRPRLIAAQIAEYAGLVDYVLIDPSGGNKERFVPLSVLNIFDAICEQSPSAIRFGVAGGLGPGRMEHLKEVLRMYSYISIDVEGGVRTPQPEDMLDMWSVMKFLEEAIQLLYPQSQV